MSEKNLILYLVIKMSTMKQCISSTAMIDSAAPSKLATWSSAQINITTLWVQFLLEVFN